MKTKHRNDEQLSLFTMKLTPREKAIGAKIADQHGSLAAFLRAAMEAEGGKLAKAKAKSSKKRAA